MCAEPPANPHRRTAVPPHRTAAPCSQVGKSIAPLFCGQLDGTPAVLAEVVSTRADACEGTDGECVVGFNAVMARAFGAGWEAERPPEAAAGGPSAGGGAGGAGGGEDDGDGAGAGAGSAAPAVAAAAAGTTAQSPEVAVAAAARAAAEAERRAAQEAERLVREEAAAAAREEREARALALEQARQQAVQKAEAAAAAVAAEEKKRAEKLARKEAAKRAQALLQEVKAANGTCVKKTVADGRSGNISCAKGAIVARILFASYGDPTGGSCVTFAKGRFVCYTRLLVCSVV
jgi:hypothetical protein